VEKSAANSTLRRKTGADHALTLCKVAQQPLCLRKIESFQFQYEAFRRQYEIMDIFA
jgi:hypothetical protein